MAGTFQVTFDNAGSPDDYVVNSVCRKIKLVQSDRTVATLAQYNVYMPKTATYPAKRLGGEAFEIEAPTTFFYPGQRPFAAETVNVASAVFEVLET